MDDLSAGRAEQRPLHEWASFDPIADVVTIYDIKYSRQLLRAFSVSPVGFTFKIVDRHEGGFTISQERNELEAAAPEMLAALKAAVALADEQLHKYYSGRSPECEQSYQACVAAIFKATGAAQ